MSEVCSEYEKQSVNDSDDVKKKQFEKLLGLMQQVSKSIMVQCYVVKVVPRGGRESYSDLKETVGFDSKSNNP